MSDELLQPQTENWFPIDAANLPDSEVVAMKSGDTMVYVGFLFKYRGALKIEFILLQSNGDRIVGLTHFMLTTDLLNLPICNAVTN